MYSPISRSSTCWKFEPPYDDVGVTVSGKSKDNFSAGDTSTIEIEIRTITGNSIQQQDVELILTTFSPLIQNNVFVNAWNIHGIYYPLDTGYSNGDQLLTINAPFLE